MCNHIVGLLFRVEKAVMSGETKLSCTSKLSTWNVPSNKVASTGPIILSEQKWSKDHYDKEGR